MRNRNREKNIELRKRKEGSYKTVMIRRVYEVDRWKLGRFSYVSWGIMTRATAESDQRLYPPALHVGA